METDPAPNPAPATLTDDVSGVASAAICSREKEWNDDSFHHYVEYITVGGIQVAKNGTRLCGSRWSGRRIKDRTEARTKPMCPICDALLNANV